MLSMLERRYPGIEVAVARGGWNQLHGLWVYQLPMVKRSPNMPTIRKRMAHSHAFRATAAWPNLSYQEQPLTAANAAARPLTPIYNIAVDPMYMDTRARRQGMRFFFELFHTVRHEDLVHRCINFCVDASRSPWYGDRFQCDAVALDTMSHLYEMVCAMSCESSFPTLPGALAGHHGDGAEDENDPVLTLGDWRFPELMFVRNRFDCPADGMCATHGIPGASASAEAAASAEEGFSNLREVVALHRDHMVYATAWMEVHNPDRDTRYWSVGASAFHLRYGWSTMHTLASCMRDASYAHPACMYSDLMPEQVAEAAIKRRLYGRGEPPEKRTRDWRNLAVSRDADPACFNPFATPSTPASDEQVLQRVRDKCYDAATGEPKS